MSAFRCLRDGPVDIKSSKYVPMASPSQLQRIKPLKKVPTMLAVSRAEATLCRMAHEAAQSMATMAIVNPRRMYPGGAPRVLSKQVYPIPGACTNSSRVPGRFVPMTVINASAVPWLNKHPHSPTPNTDRDFHSPKPTVLRRRISRSSDGSGSGQRPMKRFQCMVCSQLFSRKDHLRRHNLIHTGERPYQCDQCGASFARRDHHVRHYRRHVSAAARSEGEPSLRKNVPIAKQLAPIISS